MKINHTNHKTFVFLHKGIDPQVTGESITVPLNHLPGTYQSLCRQLSSQPEFHTPNESASALRIIAEAFLKLRKCSRSVTMQGYGVHAAALASVFRLSTEIILHTWKIPFHGPRKLTSDINDLMLERVLKHSRLVVIVSKHQQRLVEERYPKISTAWVPVAADIRWWNPGGESTDILKRLGIRRGEFLLSVGDVDRDESVVVGFAKELKIPLVRVTRDPRTAARAQYAAKQSGLAQFHCLERIPYIELRDLHRCAWAMLNAPTVSYHPAGLTTLTESMACGGVVLLPDGPTSDGYITSGKDAILYHEMSVDSLMEACKPIFNETERLKISDAARQRCVEFLNFESAASYISNALCKI
jgi:glycosyltransferase involved in cell wall biosynthesis